MANKIQTRGCEFERDLYPSTSIGHGECCSAGSMKTRMTGILIELSSIYCNRMSKNADICLITFIFYVHSGKGQCNGGQSSNVLHWGDRARQCDCKTWDPWTLPAFQRPSAGEPARPRGQLDFPVPDDGHRSSTGYHVRLHQTRRPSSSSS